MRKPDTIAYWLGDRLPARLALGLAVQQVAFLGALLVISNLFVQSHSDAIERLQFLDIAAAALIVMAVSLALQAWGRFGIGSGYFYPLQSTTAVLPAIMLATRSGGLTAAYGMIFVVALTQILFSFLIIRLRSIFTVEIAGLAVLLIGIGLGQAGLSVVFAAAPDGSVPAPAGYGVAALTFATMVAINVWSRSRLKLFAPLVGLMVGALAGWAAGLVAAPDQDLFWQAPLFRLPQLPVFGWSFDLHAVLPYMVTGLMLSVTSMGVQSVAQRFNDADWEQPDLKAMARGLRAEGLAHALAAAINGLPMAASGGAVSLAASSGVTSRYLAYWTGAILLAIAFLPKLVILSLLLPNAVTGGLLLYLATFTALSGLQLIGSRMLDNRRILAIGSGLILGMSFDRINPALEKLWPAAGSAVFSGMSLGLLTAAALAAIFRIGVHRRAARRFAISELTLDEFTAFMEGQGKLWGARHDAVRRAEHASWQALDMLLGGCIDPAAPAIELSTRFDEYSLTISFAYQGDAPPISGTRPTPEELIEDESAGARLTGFLLGRLAETVRSRRNGADCVLQLTFRN